MYFNVHTKWLPLLRHILSPRVREAQLCLIADLKYFKNQQTYPINNQSRKPYKTDNNKQHTIKRICT